MKKFLKKLAKKSLSVFMAVIMLMSSWVFFVPAPEAHAAAETLNYGLAALRDTYLTTAAINSAGGYEVIPQFNGTNVSSGNYAKLLASSNYTNDAWTGTMTAMTSDLNDCDSKEAHFEVDWHIPTDTVLLYDGSGTKPMIPVILSADPQGDGEIEASGSWVNGSDFSVVGGRWHGRDKDSGTLNFNGLITSTSDGLTAIKGQNTNLCYSKEDEATQTTGKITFDVNLSTSADLVKDYSLSFTFYSAPKDETVPSNAITIPVVNYVPLKNALTEAAKEVTKAANDAQTTLYTEESKEALRVVANQLLAAKPDGTYANINGKAWDYDTYKSDAQAAIDAYNTWKNNGGLVRQYKITWQGEGVEATTEYVVANTTPEYKVNGVAVNPTKAPSSDGHYSYTFAGWSPAPYAANKDQVYTSQFTTTEHKFTVKFLDWNGTVLKTLTPWINDVISIPGDLNPTRDGYEFTGWSPAFVSLITDDATYTAQYIKLHTVKFLDLDGKAYHTVTVKDGEAATAPKAPSKPSDSQYSYTFEGWQEDFTNVKSDLTVHPKVKTTAHKMEYYLVTEATCESNAIVSIRCSNDCGYEFYNGPYDPSTDSNPDAHKDFIGGHTYDENDIVWGSGDEATDTHLINCTACYNSTKAVKHNWQQTGTSDDASCIKPGTVYWGCPCGAEKTSVGQTAPDVHKNTVVNGKIPATCTEDGYTGDIYCNDCKETVEEGEVDPKLGHSFTKYESDGDATCTEDGHKTAKCDRCDVTDTQVDEDSKLGHDWKNEGDFLKDEATCESDEVYWQICGRCGISAENSETGSTWVKENTKLGHIYEGKVQNLNNGKHNYLCERGCGTYGYNGVKDAAKDCTYGEWSKTEADAHTKTCTECSYKVTEAHKWTRWSTTDNYKEADGQHSRNCTVCGREETENCTYTRVETKETCTTDGFTTHTCNTCGHKYTTAGTKATGHDYTDFENFQSFNNGTHNFRCKNDCGTYGVGDQINARTSCEYESYTNIGNEKHQATCKYCGYVVTEDCSGGEATCTAPAKCDKCYTYYGTTAPHSFTGTPVVLPDDEHAYLCKYCSTEGLYGVGDTEGETEECYGGEATCKDLAVCDVCKDTHGDYAAHVFDGEPVQLPGDEHAYRCSVCEKTDLYGVDNTVGETEECSGGTATCTHYAVCDICEDTHGELDDDAHDWDVWTNVEGTETHTRSCKYNRDHTETTTCEASGKAIIDADCVNRGYTLNTCDFCNHTWETDEVAPLGHDWSDWVSDGKGNHTRICEREGCHYADDHTAMTETEACIKAEAKADVTAPECLEKGYTTYTCDDCSHVWVDDYTDPTGHSYLNQKKKTDDKYYRTGKDCTTDKTYWYVCDNCDVSAETEHELDKYEGIILYWVRSASTGHTFEAKKIEDKYKATSATCTDKATYYYSCSSCGLSSKDTDDEATFKTGSALGHEWVKPADDKLADYLATDSDCTADATYYYVCNRKDCGISSEADEGDTWTKENSKSGHDFDYEGAYTAGKSATCTEAGMTAHYTCETCGKHYTDATATTEIAADKLVIAKLGHDYEDVAYKAPTCEEAGNTKYRQCQRCEYKNSEYKALPAVGHDFKAENGYYYDSELNYHAYNCSNCEVYGVNGVKWAVETVDGVTTVKGGIECAITGDFENYDVEGVSYHKKSCVCGREESAACVDADGATTTAPKCGADGYDTFVCTVCEYEWVETKEGTALEHDFSDWASVEGKNVHSRYCKNEGCGITETEDCTTETPVTGCGEQNVCDVCDGNFGSFADHNWTEVKDEKFLKSAATCTENAVYYKKCANEGCGMSSKDVKPEITWTATGTKLGHNMSENTYSVDEWENKPADFDASVIKEPTCYAEGKTISYCSRCDEYKLKSVAKDTSKHVWTDENGNENWIAVSGNCSTGITYKLTCSLCATTKTKTEPSEHDFITVREDLPTCELEGYRRLMCKNCECIEDVYYNQLTDEPADLAPLGHKVAEWTKVEATCQEYEYSYGTCTICDKIVFEETEIKADHSFKTVAAVAATCTKPGHTEYKVCEVCGLEQGKTVTTASHADINGDGKCDTCNKTLDINGEVEKSCGCICHKESGFMQFIFKIVNFFWKLFKISKTCDCGTVHW